MKVNLLVGKYILAVSGGVDSMVLLDLLAQKNHRVVNSQQSTVNSQKQEGDMAGDWRPETDDSMSFQLIVAHFNHGIRADSAKDEEFVKQAAQKYGLPFESAQANLGAGASEEKARTARYKFLNEVKKKHNASAIITAHHQDDLVETAILNMLRGTGRQGLTAMAQNQEVMRPLLGVSKEEILAYAKANKLKWREDITNKDEKYLRNYVRLKLIPKFNTAQKQQLVGGLNELTSVNKLINQEIATLSQSIIKNKTINRHKFALLPQAVGEEVLMHWLRTEGIRAFDKKTISRLSTALKTAKTGTKHEVIRGAKLMVDKTSAHLNLET